MGWDGKLPMEYYWSNEVQILCYYTFIFNVEKFLKDKNSGQSNSLIIYHSCSLKSSYFNNAVLEFNIKVDHILDGHYFVSTWVCCLVFFQWREKINMLKIALVTGIKGVNMYVTTNVLFIQLQKKLLQVISEPALFCFYLSEGVEWIPTFTRFLKFFLHQYLHFSLSMKCHCFIFLEKISKTTVTLWIISIGVHNLGCQVPKIQSDHTARPPDTALRGSTWKGPSIL